jgi:hypothetical protein
VQAVRFAAANSGSGGEPMLGEPWSQNTASAEPGAPGLQAIPSARGVVGVQGPAVGQADVSLGDHARQPTVHVRQGAYR